MNTKCTALWRRMLKNVSDTQTLQSWEQIFTSKDIFGTWRIFLAPCHQQGWAQLRKRNRGFRKLTVESFNKLQKPLIFKLLTKWISRFRKKWNVESMNETDGGFKELSFFFLLKLHGTCGRKFNLMNNSRFLV